MALPETMTDESTHFTGRIVIEGGRRYHVMRNGVLVDDGPVIEGCDPYPPGEKARLLDESAKLLSRSAREMD
jgi:hypothetical protein